MTGDFAENVAKKATAVTTFPRNRQSPVSTRSRSEFQFPTIVFATRTCAFRKAAPCEGRTNSTGRRAVSQERTQLFAAGPITCLEGFHARERKRRNTAAVFPTLEKLSALVRTGSVYHRVYQTRQRCSHESCQNGTGSDAVATFRPVGA